MEEQRKEARFKKIAKLKAKKGGVLLFYFLNSILVIGMMNSLLYSFFNSLIMN